MLYLALVINPVSLTNTVLVIICIFLFIAFLFGKIAPKFALITISLIGLCGIFQPVQMFKSAEIPSKQTFFSTGSEADTINPINTETKIPELDSPKINKEVNKKELPKYITKISIDGVSDKYFLQKFEEKSGYAIAKKWDYLITFSYSGSIRKGTQKDKSRFVYSGGHLVVNVGDDKCCCNGIVSIPKNIPLGKSMKEGLKIMSEIVEQYAIKNIDIITPIITECLPPY